MKEWAKVGPVTLHVDIRATDRGSACLTVRLKPPYPTHLSSYLQERHQVLPLGLVRGPLPELRKELRQELCVRLRVQVQGVDQGRMGMHGGAWRRMGRKDSLSIRLQRNAMMMTLCERNDVLIVGRPCQPIRGFFKPPWPHTCSAVTTSTLLNSAKELSVA